MATVYLAEDLKHKRKANYRAQFDVDADGRFLMIRNRPDLRPRTEFVMIERWTDLLSK